MINILNSEGYPITSYQYSTLLGSVINHFNKNIHSKANQISILKFLIDSGADINYRDEFDGFTILHDSFYRKDFYIFNLLLNMKDIDIEVENYEGQTVLHYVFFYSDTFELKYISKYVRILANYGAQFKTSSYFNN